MTDTNPNSADELIGAIADLVLKYKTPIGKPDAAHVVNNRMAEQAALPFIDDSHAPWKGLTGYGPGTNMTPSAELAAKMQWVASNLPGGISMRQLVLDATEKYVNELIAKHYKRT